MVDFHPSHCLPQPQCQRWEGQKKIYEEIIDRDFPNNENYILQI